MMTVIDRKLPVPKLLTFIDLGALALLHRIVVLVPPKLGRCIARSYTQHAPSGGLVIQSFVPNRAIWGSSIRDLPSTKTWTRVNDLVRAKGGTSVAQVSYAGIAELSYEADADRVLAACRNAASLARAAGFDGIELDVTRHAATLSAALVLEAAQEMIEVWGADRVGVQLAPFAWMTGQNDDRIVQFYEQLFCALFGMEIAYLHVAGAVAPGRGDLSVSALGQGLRRAFRCMVIASGLYTPASAITAVESRWADAVGFSLVIGHGDQLVRAVTAAVRADAEAQ
jgi:2,4-dienoyl-CoA reductase-like NADH-dependent reductase (Old Yellow Enzyme family)